jgi:hypothetical protein
MIAAIYARKSTDQETAPAFGVLMLTIRRPGSIGDVRCR